SADYFGHKVHIDLNEKLVMYGVTHICAIHGFSNKIFAFITSPIKNCIEIYAHLYMYSV
uniref:MULE transposase domain-containing protein n=1 Tax=Amphimedon queenslandica TaxID=400682 RepID=A0A1X7UBD8_AMPQE